jgi:hypothetical protein
LDRPGFRFIILTATIAWRRIATNQQRLNESSTGPKLFIDALKTSDYGNQRKIDCKCLGQGIKRGKLVTNFTIAMNEKDYTKNGKRKKNSTYVKCNYWFNPGVASFSMKGPLVELMGHMGAGTWTNKDGVAKANLIFRTSSIKILNIPEKNGFKGMNN